MLGRTAPLWPMEIHMRFDIALENSGRRFLILMVVESLGS